MSDQKAFSPAVKQLGFGFRSLYLWWKTFVYIPCSSGNVPIGLKPLGDTLGVYLKHQRLSGVSSQFLPTVTISPTRKDLRRQTGKERSMSRMVVAHCWWTERDTESPDTSLSLLVTCISPGSVLLLINLILAQYIINAQIRLAAWLPFHLRLPALFFLHLLPRLRFRLTHIRALINNKTAHLPREANFVASRCFYFILFVLDSERQYKSRLQFSEKKQCVAKKSAHSWVSNWSLFWLSSLHAMFYQ